jgi:predicted TIM-barrel fold metal-dependent hydrolase
LHFEFRILNVLNMPINDVHCHFFSTEFFATLARQRQGPTLVRSALRAEMEREVIGAKLADEICAELEWDKPGSAYTLADRWVRELDSHGVSRAALIASIPGDETSVAAAVAKHPDRFVGFFMLDPSSPEPVARARRAVGDLGLRGICLFPAMHHVPLHDERVQQIVDVAASRPGAAVFVHCGVLSVGVRRKLALPSRFDLRLGDPLAVARLAMTAPQVPFIIPHFGAGMLRETLMAAEACPNICLDTSSSNSWIRYTPGLTLESVFKTALSVVGATRLLFGTDSSFFPRGWQRSVYDAQKAAVAATGKSAEDEALIFGGNFDRLFPAMGATKATEKISH